MSDNNLLSRRLSSMKVTKIKTVIWFIFRIFLGFPWKLWIYLILSLKHNKSFRNQSFSLDPRTKSRNQKFLTLAQAVQKLSMSTDYLGVSMDTLILSYSVLTLRNHKTSYSLDPRTKSRNQKCLTLAQALHQLRIR